MVRRLAPILALASLLAVPHRVEAGAKDAWVPATQSPKKGAVDDPKDAPIVAACGAGVDASLMAVARELAHALATKGELPDAQEIEWRQRKAGNPHVWPRTWGAQISGSLDRKAVTADVAKWLGKSAPRVRCGVSTVRVGAGAAVKEAAVVIAVEPTADLAPLPTHVKVGAWVDLDATLLSGTNGRVVLLPPTGAPKTVLSSTSATMPAHVKARFVLAKPGRHVVQVLADDANGPRPVLEAEIHAGVEPPSAPPSSAVPGEESGDGVDDPVQALVRRINGARAADGVPALAIDAGLSKVAQAHAAAMMKAKVLGHDVGDGDPAARVAAAGGKWKVIGENVAKAKTERTAHRAVYASPSHRSNVLEGRFKKVGIGVVADPKTGYLWIAELFGG
ncbi:MAG: CAP domain-containing protein [Deltaproteobacteria bacterium]|nr:CAP domain-containing protein [Deltaproteobacteria bacterium]